MGTPREEQHQGHGCNVAVMTNHTCCTGQRGTSGTPRHWPPAWNEDVIAGLPVGAG